MRVAPLVLAAAITWSACNGAPADAPASQSTGPLAVRDAWVRAADSGATGGAYLTLANMDTMALTITGLSTTVSTRAELHETMQMGGMVHMMARPTVQLMRDSTLAMTPGGVHIMLPALTRALQVGDTVHLTLTLADGRSLPVAVPVRAP